MAYTLDNDRLGISVYVTIAIISSLVILGVVAIKTTMDRPVSINSEPIAADQKSSKVWLEIWLGCNGLGKDRMCFHTDNPYRFAPKGEKIGVVINLLHKDNIQSIRNFLNSTSVTEVFDIKYNQSYASMCEYGECGEAYKVYVLVPKTDVDKLLNAGFRESKGE